MLANRSMPSCTVIPELDYDDMVEAVDWLCAVFGFTERWRAEGHRAQLSVGDGAVVVEQRQSVERLADRVRGPHSTMVRIEDAAHHCERARIGGARIVAEPADQPYGERQYTAVDLGGHLWTFSQSIADVAPEEWGGVSVSPDPPPAGRAPGR